MTAHMNVSGPTMGADDWWAGGYDGGIWDVAVLDTGIDDNHPALSSHNFIENRCLATADALFSFMPGRDPTPDDVNGHGTTDGAVVHIWDCTGGTNQQWNVNADGSIVGVESGKCLDAIGHGTGNGTLLEIWTCNGGTNQKWSRS